MMNIIHGLVDVTQIDPTLIIDLKYAKADNFLKRKVYQLEKCVLQVWDAYRPLSIQKTMSSDIEYDVRIRVFSSKIILIKKFNDDEIAFIFPNIIKLQKKVSRVI